MSDSSFQLPSSLVSPEWLHDHLGQPGLRVVDIRGVVRAVDIGGGRQSASYEGLESDYLEAHVPGAIFVDWTTDIVDPNAEIKAQIAPPDRFAAAMSARGIGNETAVVVVDGMGGHLATRLWWALRFYGHDNVAVLDGGMNAWQKAGLPTDRGLVKVEAATFIPRSRPDLISDVHDVLALTTSRERQLVDARDAPTFHGDVQRAVRGGHIPTAINLPSSQLLGEDGRWKSPSEIRSTAKAAGVDPDTPVTAYCNGGVTATAVLFGLHLAGLDEISNYDGSWNEWGPREDLPVAGNQDLWSDPQV